LDRVEAKMIEAINPTKSRDDQRLNAAADAAAYHLSSGGQRVRAKLALHAGHALGLSSHDAVTIATAVELLHNASLVHDDIQDRDPTRRGQPAVWVCFGVNTAICTGDLLLSAAYAALSKLENPQTLHTMLSLVHERTATAIGGQCGDLLAGADDASDTAGAIARYQEIAAAKSGALLCLPIELALLGCGQGHYLEVARRAIEAFATGYQIVDDLNDVHSDVDPGTARNTYNIVAIYTAAGDAAESTAKAKKLGRLHLDAAIEFAGKLPSGCGALLIELAHHLRQLLVDENDRH